jgi:hypothetical protein
MVLQIASTPTLRGLVEILLGFTLYSMLIVPPPFPTSS